MEKKIFHDYWNSFRWSRFRKIYSKNAIFYLLWSAYMLCVPFITNSAVDNIWSYLVVMLYLIFVVLNASVVPICLPKLMFLTPMSKEERHRYMSGMMKMKILVPAFVGFGVSVLWMWLRKAPLWIGAANYIAGCSIVLAGTITTWPGSIWFRQDGVSADQPVKRIEDVRLKGLRILSTTEIIIAISAYMIGMVFLENTDFEKLWVKILLAIATLVHIILIPFILRYVNPIVEIATDYEKTYSVDKIFRTGMEEQT